MADSNAKAVNKVELANGEVLLDLTNDTIKPEDLRWNVTAHDASGVQIRGQMAEFEEYSVTLSYRDQVLYIPSGYHDGKGYAHIHPTERAKLIADNIKKGVSILGVEGSLESGSSGIEKIDFWAVSINKTGTHSLGRVPEHAILMCTEYDQEPTDCVNGALYLKEAYSGGPTVNRLVYSNRYADVTPYEWFHATESEFRINCDDYFMKGTYSLIIW